MARSPHAGWCWLTAHYRGLLFLDIQVSSVHPHEFQSIPSSWPTSGGKDLFTTHLQTLTVEKEHRERGPRTLDHDRQSGSQLDSPCIHLVINMRHDLLLENASHCYSGQNTAKEILRHDVVGGRAIGRGARDHTPLPHKGAPQPSALNCCGNGCRGGATSQLPYSSYPYPSRHPEPQLPRQAIASLHMDQLHSCDCAQV